MNSPPNLHMHNVVVKHPDGSETNLGTLWMGELESRVYTAVKEWESKRDRYAEFRKAVEEAASRAHTSW